MGILPEAAAAPMREALEIALPDRCTVQRGGSPSDGKGGWTDNPSDIATGIPCRVDKDTATERELIVAGRPTAEGAYLISLSTVAARWPGGVVDIKSGDTLVVTGDGAGTYQAAGSGGPATDQYLREIRCLKTE